MKMRDIINTVSEGLVQEAAEDVPLATTAQNEISRADWFGTYIAMMTPDEYIALARRRDNPPPLPSNTGGNMDRLRADIEQNGLKALPWLTIDADTGEVVGQEGLHRVAVLKDMGYAQIPVRVFAKRGGEFLDQDGARLALRSLRGRTSEP